MVFFVAFFFLSERKLVAATKYSAIIFSYARSTITKEKKGVFEKVKLKLVFINGLTSSFFSEKTMNYFH